MAKCFISGWGQQTMDQNQTEVKDILQWAKVSTVKHLFCKAAYWKKLNDHQLCAGNTDSEHKNSCLGDSGGPLTCESRGKVLLVGIDSYGYKYDCASYFQIPDVFTKVSSFSEWIEENMDPNCSRRESLSTHMLLQITLLFVLVHPDPVYYFRLLKSS